MAACKKLYPPPSGRCAPELGFRVDVASEVSRRAKRNARSICRIDPLGWYPIREESSLYYSPCALSTEFNCLGAGNTHLVDEHGKPICASCEDRMAHRIQRSHGEAHYEEWLALNYARPTTSGLFPAHEREITPSCTLCGSTQRCETLCVLCARKQEIKAASRVHARAKRPATPTAAGRCSNPEEEGTCS